MKNRKGSAANRRERSPKNAKDRDTDKPAAAAVSESSSGRSGAAPRDFPARSISASLPSPANFTGPITLARLFGTRGADWPRQFKLTPFRPGRPHERGLLSALVRLLSAPVLGVPRMVHGIGAGVRDAASEPEPTPKDEMLTLRMKLETGRITEEEFQREKARMEAAAEKPLAKRAKPPKRKRRKKDWRAC